MTRAAAIRVIAARLAALALVCAGVAIGWLYPLAVLCLAGGIAFAASLVFAASLLADDVPRDEQGNEARFDGRVR